MLLTHIFLLLIITPGIFPLLLLEATGHSLVSLCRSVVDGEKNQITGPLMAS